MGGGQICRGTRNKKHGGGANLEEGSFPILFLWGKSHHPLMFSTK